MQTRPSPSVVRALAAIRLWLKDAWVSRVSLWAWLREPRGNLVLWEGSGKAPRQALALETLESRETPDDLFGLLGTPLLGTGLALLGGPLATPATVMAQGWAASATPPPSPRLSSTDGLHLPGLTGDPASPKTPSGDAASSGSSDSGPAAPSAPSAPGGQGTPLSDDPFGDPLGQDWLNAVGTALDHTTPPGGYAGQGAGSGGATSADSAAPPAFNALAPGSGSSSADSAASGVTFAPPTSASPMPSTGSGAAATSSGTPTGATSVQGNGGSTAGTATSHSAAYLQAYGRTQLAFEPNEGQTASQVSFLSHGPGFETFLTAGGAVLSLARSAAPSQPGQVPAPAASDVLTLSFAGAANASPQVYGTDPLPSASNYFVGNDPSQWLSDVPNYAGVLYKNVYPGVDVQFHGDSQKDLEYDFIIAPGADLSQVKVSWQGAQSVQDDGHGNLLVTTASGRTLTETAPALYQTTDGVKQAVSGRHVLNADGTVGFQATGYDATKPLVVDPSLIYSTYLGGSGDDKAYAVAVDASGSAYVTGSTTSTDFPTGSPYQSSNAGSTDVFVTKLNASGSGVVFSTYLGGSGSDVGYGIALDPSGAPVVVGVAGASNFPTTNGAYQAFDGGSDAFVAKLSASGSALVYSTALGPQNGVPTAVAVDSSGDAYVTGHYLYGLIGPSFPTTSGAFQTTMGGATDAFVTKLNPTGTTLVYSAFLGGSGDDFGTGIALDSANDAYVTGYTASNNFPTANPYQTSLGSATYSAFLTKVNPSGGALLFSTYLGTAGDNRANAVAVDQNGAAYLTGSTTSSVFPTTSGAYQTSAPSGGQNAFVARFSASGTLGYSTYLGGTSGDSQGNAVAVDATGQAAVAGTTHSSTFPTTSGAYQTTAPGTTGNSDAFLAFLGTAGGLNYSSYLGGGGNDSAQGVALDAYGAAYLAGYTNSSNFPTSSGAYQLALNGATSISYDAFVSKFSQSPAAPAFTAINPDTGSFNNDRLTDTGNLQILGTAAANATVTLYQEGVGQIDTFTADASGNWTSNYYHPTLPATTPTLPEGVAAFTATQTVGGVTSAPTADWLVTVDLTPPAVALTAPAFTSSQQPLLTVTASDLNGLAVPATVAITVYDSTGTTVLNSNSAAATLTDGQARFRLAYALTPGTTYKIQAQVNDKAGNTGSSAKQTVQVTAATAWSLTGVQALASDPRDGDAQSLVGDVSLAHPLDLDQSPGTVQSGGAALVYHSDSVSVRPVIQAMIQSANNVALPASITGVLTWNGGLPTTFTYPTTGDAPGDLLVVSAQVPSAVTTTGRYRWTLVLTPTGQAPMTASGSTFVVAQDASPFGAGWMFAPTDRLVDIPADLLNGLPAGKLRVFGTGEWRFYAGTTTFTSPANDNGTLAVSGSGWTYTTPDGQVRTFNSSGYQTQWTSADGQETLQFRYSGGTQLTGMTAVDGGLTTFTYSSGLLSTIQTVNSRTYTMAYSGANLTQITDPDSGVHTFSYDGGHRLTGDTFANLQDGWSYGSSGALATYTRGGASSPDQTTVTPVAAQALTAAVAGPVLATATDADGNTTAWQLDTQGRPLQQVAADGGLTQWARDAGGRVTTQTDPLGRTTSFARDAAGYVTLETLPDTHTMGWQYQTAFHALISYTDERHNTTTYAYDGGDHRTSSTDALTETTAYHYSASGLLTSVTDPLTHTTTYAYDADRRLTKVTDADLNALASYSYDANGNLTTTTDANLHVTTTTYDPMGRLTKTTDAAGGVWTATYNAAGLELGSTDARTNHRVETYDAAGRGLVVQEQVAVGTSAQATTLDAYDAAGRLTSARDADGYSTTFAYDPVGRTTSSTDPLGGVDRSVYDLAGQTVASRDVLGRLATYAYDARGRNTSTTEAAGTAIAYTTTAGFDDAGNLTSVSDPLGNRTTYAYDALNRLTQTTDPTGSYTYSQYDPAGNVTSVQDFNHVVTSYGYDPANRLTLTVDDKGGLNRNSAMAYDPAGNVTSAADGLTHTTAYRYDPLNRPTAVVDALTHTTTTLYDAVGDVTAVTDALGKSTVTLYDAQNRATQVTDPNAHDTFLSYDPVGDVVQTTAPGLLSTRTPVDALGRHTASIDPLGALTQNQLDAAGQTTAVVDADGNTTRYVYDALGRQAVSIDPLGQRTTTTYDGAARVSTVTDRDGRQQVFRYDADSRVTGVTWLSAAGATVNLLTYTYDDNGNQLTAEDFSGRYTNVYDTLNRLTQQTNPFGQILTYKYDNADRLTERDDSQSGVLTYGYDNANRLTTAQFGGTGQTPLRADFAYSNRDQMTGLTRYSDLAGSTVVATTVYAYDDAQRLTAITTQNASAATLAYYNYGYDSADRVSSETWQSVTATGTVSGTHSYTYNQDSELTNDGTIGAPGYVYDAAQNRTAVGSQSTPVGTDNRLTTDGVWTYTYDAAGDMTQKSKGTGLETWFYAYDNLDRLTSVKRTSDGTTALTTATYVYDVYNNLISTNEWVGSGSATLTRFDYDGTQVWAETDGSNTIQVRDLYAGGMLLARTASVGQPNAGVAWYLSDRLGSTTDLIGAASSANVLDHLDYDGFGNVTAETSASVGDRHKFAGGQTEANTGLVRFGRRWYNSVTGRWQEEDPIGFGGGQANLSEYVGNNPVNGTDPSGLWTPEGMMKSYSEKYGVPGRRMLQALVAAGFTFDSDNGGNWMYEWDLDEQAHTVLISKNSWSIPFTHVERSNESAADLLHMAAEHYLADNPIGSKILGAAYGASFDGGAHAAATDPGWAAFKDDPGFQDFARLDSSNKAWVNAITNVAIDDTKSQLTWIVVNYAMDGALQYGVEVLQSLRAARTAEKAFVDAYMIGRKGGKALSEAEFTTLQQVLKDKYKVTLWMDKTGKVLSKGDGALYRAFSQKQGGGKIMGMMYVREGATEFDILHEAAHMFHHRALGDAYFMENVGEEAANLFREQFAYDQMTQPYIWDSLNAAERAHSIDYIKMLGGNTRGMKP